MNNLLISVSVKPAPVVIKYAIIDVISGQWKTFQPTPIEGEFFSTIMNRDGKNQSMEIDMNKAVYTRATDELFNRLAKIPREL